MLQVHINLELLNSNGKNLILSQFHREALRSLSKTPFKVATSLHHYCPSLPLLPAAAGSRARPRGKLQLMKGETVVLPSCVKLDPMATPVDLQLCCAVALAPAVQPVTAGRKIRADRCCTDVKVCTHNS